jgi:translation initiation factor 3 subunit M
VSFLSLWGQKDSLDQAAAQAITASVKAIQNPTTFDCGELLCVPAVAALKTGDEKAQAVHRLLEIYSREKLEDYEQFVTSKRDLIASIGLKHETCVDNLRMLSLASLATDMSEIPYDHIKTILKLEKDKDVEWWVIKVHRAGLVQVKMDQIRRIVVVNRTTARVFSTTDWQELKTRVEGWRHCLQNMSVIIQGAKESADLA